MGEFYPIDIYSGVSRKNDQYLHPHLAPTNYEMPLEVYGLFYEGRPMIPERVQNRVAQMILYTRFYNNDFRDIDANMTVPMNWHRITPLFLADALMSKPPEIEGDAPPVSKRFMQSLNEAMYNMLISYGAMGTGLLRFKASKREGIFEVDSPSPVLWMPIDDEASVLLTPHYNFSGSAVDSVSVEYDYGNGETESLLFDANGQTIGKNITEGDGYMQYGDPAAWDALYESVLGRIGMTFNVPRAPYETDWGLSLYHDINALAFDSNDRRSYISNSLRRTQNPFIKIEPDSGENNQNAKEILESLKNNDEEFLPLEIQTLKATLEGDGESTMFIVPPGLKSIDYMTYDGSFDAAEIANDKTNELMFAATFIPGRLYGFTKSGGEPSGTSLDRQYFRAAAYIEKTINTLVSAYNKAILTGMVLEGASATEVSRYADVLKIEWNNKFDSDTTMIDGGVIDTERGSDSGETIAAPQEGSVQ